MKHVYILIGFLVFASQTYAVPAQAKNPTPSKYVEYDISVDPAYSGTSFENKLMTITLPTQPTLEDSLRRVRSVSVAIGKLTDKQWLLVRNFLGYGNLFTAKESKQITIDKWRNSHLGSPLELAKYEAAIGRALIDDGADE